MNNLLNVIPYAGYKYRVMATTAYSGAPCHQPQISNLFTVETKQNLVSEQCTAKRRMMLFHTHLKAQAEINRCANFQACLSLLECVIFSPPSAAVLEYRSLSSPTSCSEVSGCVGETGCVLQRVLNV